MHESIHNGNESKNPFLISNLTKMLSFMRKWQKNHFFGEEKICDKLKKYFELKKKEN